MRISRQHRPVRGESAVRTPARGVRRWAAALAALALLPAGALALSAASAPPAAADTSQFRGVNWAVFGDNFSTEPLVIQGLDRSDSYDTVYAKADVVYGQMSSLLDVNTVRLPVNTHTVGTDWWGSYRGVIDAATDHGFKVILAYWEDGAAEGGRVTDYAAWNTMWSEVTHRYGENEQVYFEPMNEPHGYSSAEWRDVAADWMEYHYSAPPERTLIGGTGYSQDLRDVCGDPRFADTLLSFHHYAFFYGENTYDGWLDHIRTRLGDCADRAVLTEFGGAMHTGLDYGDANSSDNFVRHVRAATQVMRENSMGGTYWPALGGKPTEDLGYDGYSIMHMTGSGTDLTLSIRNESGADRLRWGWGD